MTMIKALRSVLYTIAATALLLGLWGILSNAALPLTYGKRDWNFFEQFEKWDDRGGAGEHHRKSDFPWWAISWQTPYPYLDPYLAGPVGYGFYAFCLTWGMGTMIMLRSYLRPVAGRVFWPAVLFCTWWLIGLGGIIAHVVFFACIAIEAKRAGLAP
jgi:hypothetical protein